MAENNLVITIGRECGSGGHEIGEKLAEHYGIPFYDRSILKVLAEKTGQNPDKLSKIEGKVTGKFLSFFRKDSFKEQQGSLMEKMSASDILFIQEKTLIEEMAEKDSFVIVGRAANYILSDHPRTLRLFIYAPEEFRIPRTKESFSVYTDEEAKRKMLAVDKERKDYFNYYTDMVWASTDGNDFMIDSSILGIDGTVELLIYLIEKKFGR